MTDGAATDRDLDWDGCFNVRDLGGLRTTAGGETAWRALVRADSLAYLTATGWSALYDVGIRTVLDLRNDSEIDGDVARRPDGVTTVHVPLDDDADTALWTYLWDNELDGTPLYYRPFLERKPERCAAAVAAIAAAKPGGVAFHCGGGRDRTGLVSALVLSLAGIEPEEIVADYELSNVRLPPFWAAHGIEDQRPEIAAVLTRKQTSARALLLDLLGSFDADAYLRRAGLSVTELAAVRSRLLGD